MWYPIVYKISMNMTCVAVGRFAIYVCHIAEVYKTQFYVWKFEMNISRKLLHNLIWRIGEGSFGRHDDGKMSYNRIISIIETEIGHLIIISSSIEKMIFTVTFMSLFLCDIYQNDPH